MAFTVYILANRKNGTIYAGHTDDLYRRVCEHRDHQFKGFTDRYDVTRLVWFERHETRDGAFRREHHIKKWRRVWKLDLIEKTNPEWRDLFDDFENVLDPTSPLA